MSPYISLSYERVPRGEPSPPPPGPSAPTITVEPTDATILIGTSATFNVTAIGTAPLLYQWYEGVSGNTSTPIAGATSSSYTTPNLTADTQYWVRVSNVAGSDDSITVEAFVVPLPADVLGPPEYIGALRISTSGIENSIASYGGMGGRDVGGTVKLYFTASLAPSGPPNPADKFSESIIEVIDPGSGYNTNYASAPIAVTNFYTNEYREKRFTWRVGLDDPDFFPGAFAANAGVYYDETTDLLYVCYADVYDTGALQTHGLCGVELSAVQTVPPYGSTIGHGPWSIRITDGDGAVRRGPRACEYLSRHSVTGHIMVGSTLTSGDASCTWGPSMHTGTASFPTASTPVGKDEVFDIPDCGMHYYHMGFGTGPGGGYQLTTAGLLQPGKSLRSFRRRLTPGPYEYFEANACGPADDVLNVNPAIYQDAIGFTGSWRSNEFVGGGMYIQIGTKAVYLYTAQLIDGHAWYQNECKPVCNHGLPPAAGLETTGPTTTSLFPAFIGIDPSDVAAVLAGTKESWEIEAAYEVNAETAYPGIKTSDNTHGTPRAFAMGYFHPPTRRLFVIAQRADDSRPGNGVGALIHVFQWPENP